MKRKVIQIANSTQLVSLPRKWALKYGIKKGDEMEVEEQGNKILISTDKGTDMGYKEIDINGLDRTTILYYIQTLYRAGYDEIKITFTNPTTFHFRLNENENIISIIHNEVNRLIGYEIIQQKENFCIVKNLSQSTISEFDSVLRRIFLLINDTSSDLLKGAKEMSHSLIETVEEKHDSITKFVSYCLRLLNKYGYPDHRKTAIVYHIVLTLDRLTDVLKNVARDILKIKRRFDVKTIQLIQLVDQCIHTYSEYFFKFDLQKATKIYEKRHEMLTLLDKYRDKIKTDELILTSKMAHSLELLNDLEVARMGIEY